MIRVLTAGVLTDPHLPANPDQTQRQNIQFVFVLIAASPWADIKSDQCASAVAAAGDQLPGPGKKVRQPLNGFSATFAIGGTPFPVLVQVDGKPKQLLHFVNLLLPVFYRHEDKAF